jgi:hypothetical protein
MTLTPESVFKDLPRLAESLTGESRPWTVLRRLSAFTVGCAAAYGFAMGLQHSLGQAAASALKVPALFFLTLMICLPTLHFVSLLFGAPARFLHSTAVLLMGLAATSVLLAAFAPIALFFLVTGSSYEFLLLLHVSVFVFCGAAGLRVVSRGVGLLRARLQSEETPASSMSVLRVWMLLYMFVGSQMAYVLGPFVGRDSRFWWFHNAGGNFYTYVLSVVGDALR